MIRRSLLQLSACSFVLALLPFAAFAQSPNTASIVVAVVDQNGAVIRGANVSVINSATSAVRDADTGDDGSVTVSALPLTGTYTVKVSKDGFGSEEQQDIHQFHPHQDRPL